MSYPVAMFTGLRSYAGGVGLFCKVKRQQKETGMFGTERRVIFHELVRVLPSRQKMKDRSVGL